MLHIQSILAVGGVVHLVCLGMLVPMRRDSTRARGSIDWAIAGLLGIAGSMLAVGLAPLLFGSASGGLPRGFMQIALAVNVAGSVSFSEALRRLDGRVPANWAIYMGAIVLAVVPFLLPSLLTKASDFVALSAMLSGGVVFTLLDPLARSVSQSQARLSRIVIIAGFVLGGALLSFPIMRLSMFLPTASMLTPTMLAVTLTLSALAAAIVGQVGTMLLIGVINGRIAQEFRKLAAFDTLTGLRGRRAFFEDGARLLAARFSASRMTCLMMLDLDHFKKINDTYGHPAGDKALVTFSNMLRVSAPESAIIGRYGGEEFCMLLPVEDRAQARDIGRQFVLRTRSVVVDTEKARIPLTVSIGVAVSPTDGVNLDDLVLAADRRVYLAKEGGRNQAVWADSGSKQSGPPAAIPRHSPEVRKEVRKGQPETAAARRPAAEKDGVRRRRRPKASAPL